MTDEKMIEEMAKCMCSSYESGKGCNTCPTIWCYADECATRAFCNGYRKIPENAVVLTREELHERDENAYQVGITMGKKFGSKETAREIYTTLKEMAKLNGVKNPLMGERVSWQELDTRAKQYGVEVEE